MTTRFMTTVDRLVLSRVLDCILLFVDEVPKTLSMIYDDQDTLTVNYEMGFID